MHQQNDWEPWLPLATAVHNRAINSTTKTPPSGVLLGYLPRLDYRWGGETAIPQVEDRVEIATQRREQAKASYRVSGNLCHKRVIPRHTTSYQVMNLEYHVIPNHVSASRLWLAPPLTHTPSDQ